MDGVVADFDQHIIENKVLEVGEKEHSVRASKIKNYAKSNPTFFEVLPIIGNSVEVIKEMSEHFDIYFLSTPIWDVPESYTGKRIWLEQHFGEVVHKKLILCHNKSLLIGDYLIDDRTKNGASEFKGNFIHFATNGFETIEKVRDYIYKKENIKCFQD